MVRRFVELKLKHHENMFQVIVNVNLVVKNLTQIKNGIVKSFYVNVKNK